MDVTANLLRVFQVEKQIRGLKARLDSAEKFLGQQTKDVASLDSRRGGLESQIKTLSVQAADHEGEMKRIDTRSAALRTQMESAQTNKEYQAFLVELNNLKTDRDKFEAAALELMGKADELRKQVAEIDQARGEREQVRKVAAGDRDQRSQEIQTRLAELEAERVQATEAVPTEILTNFKRLLHTRGEDAMAPVEVQDRKRHEYTCGACQMSIPVDAVNALLTKGKLTTCASCQCILFLDEEALKALRPPEKREPTSRSRSAKNNA